MRIGSNTRNIFKSHVESKLISTADQISDFENFSHLFLVFLGVSESILRIVFCVILRKTF